MLSAGGIQSIKNSITTTLELYEHIAEKLGTPVNNLSIDSLLYEIKNYLSLFRTLLIIDNLETLTDKHLRNFLIDIPLGSKILLTSRVGLGEIEIRYSLESLDSKTAVDLAKRYSSSLNLDIFMKAKDSILKKYCLELYNNPLLIKWFISGVSKGTDPSTLLNKRSATFKDAIEFCYTNLFEKLNEDERRIVNVLSSAKRPLSFAEIIFITKAEGRGKLELALQGLHNASMISRISDTRNDTILYALTNTAHEYVSMFSPPPSEVFGDVHKAMRELRIFRDTETAKIGVYKYDIYALSANNQDERIAAVNLKHALEELRSKNFDEARRKINEAKELLPSYSEIYRISGIIESEAGNVYKASEEYDRALQIDPYSAIINYNYALFINKYLEDFDSALDKLNVALKHDKKSEALLAMKALLLSRLGQFAESISIYEDLLTNTDSIPTKWLRSVRDQSAEAYRRLCERNLKLEEFDSCKSNINRALEILELSFKDNTYDHKIVTRLFKIIDEALVLTMRTNDLPYATSIIAKLTKLHPYFPNRTVQLYNANKFKDFLSVHVDLINDLNMISPY